MNANFIERNKKMRKVELPKCNNDMCFAHMEGKCMVLDSIIEGKEVCPFFKTPAQIETARKRTAARLRKLGLVAKMKKKYGGVYDELDWS